MRYRFSRSLLAAVVAASFALPAAASAQLLFDTGASTTSTAPIGSNFSDGIGQGVVVTTATHLTQFGFYGSVPVSGGDKFLIFESTSSNLVFSQARTFNTNDPYTWLESGAISWDLVAGKTYYFGFITNGGFVQLGGTSPAGTHSENGLALTGGATFYTNYSTPTSTPSPYNVPPSLSLRLEGTQGATTTPEPSSMALLGTGLTGLVPMVRRRRR